MYLLYNKSIYIASILQKIRSSFISCFYEVYNLPIVENKTYIRKNKKSQIKEMLRYLLCAAFFDIAPCFILLIFSLLLHLEQNVLQANKK